jgi:hypothetical protein
MYKRILIFLCSFDALFASPVAVSSGGLHLTSATAYGLLCGGSTTAAFQFLGTGTTGQGLVSGGSSAVPVWQNVLPGYIAGTHFAHAGTTSTLAASPDNTIIISTAVPASITSAATDNIALGYNALNAVASNVQCVAIGSGALVNATGSYNIAIGYNAGGSITTGHDNTAVGSGALSTNQTGSFNVAYGRSALANSTVDGLTAVGYQALNANTSGTNNAAVGYQAGLLIQGGSRNSICGYQALATNVSGNDNVAVGYQALNVCTGSQNVAVGTSAGATATSGSNNIYIGYNSTPISVSESNNIVIGNSSSATATFFGITGQTSTSGVNMLINASSLLGTTTSSQRFKENIVPIAVKTLDALHAVQIVQFHYIGDDTQELNYGMIAEDVNVLLPETVVRDQQGEIFTIQYQKYVPLVIQQAQENLTQLNDLQEQVALLRKQIETLKNGKTDA